MALLPFSKGNIIDEGTAFPNFVLGGYFGVHRRSESKGTCGKIDQEFGVYLVEAMRYAINQINKNNETLYGTTLGYRIADTCSSMGSVRTDFGSMVLQHRIIGLVGPSTSDEAILAATAFGLFFVRLVSYSASSIDLADRVKFFNFFRTIPADDIQNHVLIDILKQFNWTYVSTVNSHGNYGQRGMDDLISMMAPQGICIATRNVLPKSPNKSHFKAVVRNLNADPKATTVLLFTTAEDTVGLLTEARSSKRFTWLSSSAWSADMETVRGIKDVAKGAILLNYAGMNNPAYRQHFLGMKLHENNYTWFAEFWQDAFNCSLSLSSSSKRICTGNENLTESNFYGRYAAANAVIDAVNVFACALRKTIARGCPEPGINRTICAKSSTFSFRYAMGMYLKYGSGCTDVINAKKMNKQGALYRDIEVVNFDGKTYRTIGVWKQRNSSSATGRGTLNLTDPSSIIWYHGRNDTPQSVCSLPCKSGQITLKSVTKICCFSCIQCGANAVVNNNTCVQCGEYEVPNQQRTVCRKLPLMRRGLLNGAWTTTLVGSTIGVTLNTFVLFMFIKHRNSRIVRASSRELSFVILFGLYLCFLSPYVFFMVPSNITCGLRRFIFGISLTACYTPLMLKTNRIFRIFRAANVMVSMPQLVSPQSQILICLGLLGIQLLLYIMWLVGDPPTTHLLILKNSSEMAALCQSNIYTVIINLIPCFCMMTISTVYAFKTRKFPKNYNEAFSIGVTMYISCFLWALFIPLLLWVKIESSSPFAQEYVIASFSNLIGLVSLVGLFGPKIRRLLCFRKEAISSVLFSTTRRDHSVNHSVDISIERSIDMSLDRSVDFSTVATLEDEKKDATTPVEQVRVRRKTF